MFIRLIRITWHLQNKTNIHVLAKQCGNSAKTIEENYNHIVPEMHVDELSGINDNELENLASNADNNQINDTNLNNLKGIK